MKCFSGRKASLGEGLSVEGVWWGFGEGFFGLIHQWDIRLKAATVQLFFQWLWPVPFGFIFFVTLLGEWLECVRQNTTSIPEVLHSHLVLTFDLYLISYLITGCCIGFTTCSFDWEGSSLEPVCCKTSPIQQFDILGFEKVFSVC